MLSRLVSGQDIDSGREAELLAHERVVVEGVALVARLFVMGEVDVPQRVGSNADIVVNNAAIYEESHFLDASYEDWQRIWRETLEANLIGPSNVIFHAGRSMARRGGGVIVCVSSRGAFRGEPDAPAYGASKAGLNQLSQSAAKALAPSNVVVGVVAPGFVDTAMAAEVLNGPRGDAIRGDSPFNRVASVEEVAEAVLYFTNTDAKWSSGAIIDVNGASYLRS